MKARDEIENAGWVSIDNLMDLLSDVVYKFTDKTNVSPMEMRKYIDKQLDTIFDHSWQIKMRRTTDVYIHSYQGVVHIHIIL